MNRLGVMAFESLADLRSSSVMKNDGRKRNTTSHLTIMINTACEHIFSVQWAKKLALELIPAKVGFCPNLQSHLTVHCCLNRLTSYWKISIGHFLYINGYIVSYNIALLSATYYHYHYLASLHPDPTIQPSSFTLYPSIQSHPYPFIQFHPSIHIYLKLSFHPKPSIHHLSLIHI